MAKKEVAGGTAAYVKGAVQAYARKATDNRDLFCQVILERRSSGKNKAPAFKYVRNRKYWRRPKETASVYFQLLQILDFSVGYVEETAGVRR